MSSCYLFAGPSLDPSSCAVAQARGIRVLPPVVRGDIRSLTANAAPATMIVADGRFGDVMSVGHAELRRAVERGWRVWGLSSIGAIRAYELRKLGMRGYGRVYGMFLRLADFQDDEVALLHNPDPPYCAGSEPLIHLRVALTSLVRRQAIDRQAARRIIQKLKALWFGERTLALFEDHLRVETPSQRWGMVRWEIKHFNRFRIKEKDLTAFLTVRPWLRPWELTRSDFVTPVRRAQPAVAR